MGSWIILMDFDGFIVCVSLSVSLFVCLFACLFLFLQQMKLVQGEKGEKNRACCLSPLPQVFSPNLLGPALSHDYRSFLWGCRRERSSLPASPALIDKGQQREQSGVNISPNTTTVCNGETGAQGKEIVQFCQPAVGTIVRVCDPGSPEETTDNKTERALGSPSDLSRESQWILPCAHRYSAAIVVMITLYQVLLKSISTVEKVNSRRWILATNSRLKDTDAFPATAQPHRGRSSGTFRIRLPL